MYLKNELPKIWTIGCGKNNCDLSISWFDPPPNLYEPDIIVMNLESLDEKVLERIDKEQFNEMVNKIFNKFINKGTLIYIISDEKRADEGVKEYKNTEKKLYYNPTLIYKIPAATYSNYDVSPINFKMKKVDGKKIQYDLDETFSSYFGRINRFNLLLHDFHLSPLFQNIIPVNETSSAIVHSLSSSNTSVNHQIELVTEEIAMDNTQNPISVRCWLKIEGYWKSGEAIYLPRPSNISIDGLIESILHVYGIRSHIEKIPDWAYHIKLPRIDDIQKKIDASQEKLAEIKTQINDLKVKKESIERYYYLLSFTGTNLEDIVGDAFMELGFREIRRIRTIEKEDWILEFETVSDYKIAVLEVKGIDNRIKHDHLAQTDEWVSDYYKEGQVVKGLFIPNQFRKNPYPASKDAKSGIGHNDLIYAKKRDLCILPSCVLFETVIKHLGGKRRDRKDIEQIISETQGILHEL